VSKARKYSWGATFYGKRKDKLGTLVFKDNAPKRYLFGNI